MQLGARWRAGEPPHRSVPESLFEAIRAEEAGLTEPRWWTLTWLEGLPRIELEGRATLGLRRDGSVQRTDGTSAPGAALGGSVDDDDDDDWLED